MVVVNNVVEDANACPVLGAWMKIEALVSRAATHGKLAMCNTAQLDRTTVADNHELLIPILATYGGFLASAF